MLSQNDIIEFFRLTKKLEFGLGLKVIDYDAIETYEIDPAEDDSYTFLETGIMFISETSENDNDYWVLIPYERIIGLYHNY